MAELRFYHGTMDSGKSLLALQMNYERKSKGQDIVRLTRNSRDGEGKISSRLGIAAAAFEIRDTDNIYSLLVEAGEIDLVIVDEAQFFSEEQIDQLAWVVDDLKIDVYAFGLLTDFRSELFPGSKRLVELADRVESVQACTTCWCGAKGGFNARVVDGVMTKEGPQVAVGDTSTKSVVQYEVLCREHWTMGVVSGNL